MAPRVTLDLSALASGHVVKNRPQARANKSNVTRGAIDTLTITRPLDVTSRNTF